MDRCLIGERDMCIQERSLKEDHFSVSLREIRGMITYQSKFSTLKIYVEILAKVLSGSQFAVA